MPTELRGAPQGSRGFAALPWRALPAQLSGEGDQTWLNQIDTALLQELNKPQDREEEKNPAADHCQVAQGGLRPLRRRVHIRGIPQRVTALGTGHNSETYKL